MAIWLHILASWPEPAGPSRRQLLRVVGDERLGRLVVGLIAAAHHGEHAVLGARLAARYRRIDEAAALFRSRGMQFARHVGRGSGVVNEHRALLHRLESAVRSGGDGTQVVIVADAGENEVRAVCGFLGRQGARAAMLFYPFVGLGSGTVVDDDIMSALALEVSRHRVSHHAEAQPCSLESHVPSLPSVRIFDIGLIPIGIRFMPRWQSLHGQAFRYAR
jgi:hypothetical protein